MALRRPCPSQAVAGSARPRVSGTTSEMWARRGVARVGVAGGSFSGGTSCGARSCSSQRTADRRGSASAQRCGAPPLSTSVSATSAMPW